MKKTTIYSLDSKQLNSLQKGMYSNQYLIYNRKSTDEADSQKNSIDYQIRENTRFATNNMISIAGITIPGFCTNGIISEKHSGFKEDFNVLINDNGVVQYKIDRPKFQKLLMYLSQEQIKGVICLCWDRISRNKGDDTIIRKLMHKGVDFRFVYANYEKTSSGALHMDIDGMFSQHHSRVTSEKVTLAIRNSKDKGICTYRAPVGYLNVGSMENKPLDPERAPLIRKIFELYATGNWSLADLARFAKEHGLTSSATRRRRTQEEVLDEKFEINDIPKVHRPLSYTHISKILSNRFYNGKIKNSEGVFIRSISHEAIVNDRLFEQVQRKLKGRTVSIHYTNKLDQPFRGVLRCVECKRCYTPYSKKGIVYYGAKCSKSCKNSLKNINLNYVNNGIQNAFESLCFTESELRLIDQKIESPRSQMEEKIADKWMKLDRQIRKLQEDIAYLKSNKLSLLKTGVYSPEELIKEENRLQEAYINLTNQNVSKVEELKDDIKGIQKLSKLLSRMPLYYKFGTISEKEALIGLIFSELLISENGLIYKCVNGFEAFENRNLFLGDPTENRTPITGLKSRCPNR